MVRLWRIALQFHHLHLAGFQTHRRVVADFLTPARAGGVHQRRFSLQRPLPPQIGIRLKVGLVDEEYLASCPSRRRRQRPILPHERFPTRRVRFHQPLPGTLQHKPQPMQVVQIRLRRTPAQWQPKALLHKLPHRLPVPVGHSDARLRRQFLHRCLQLPALLHVQRGGEPPVCSKTSALGPPSAKALTHWPMVWASRSKARPTAAAVHPWANSHTACHRSRSRGDGARYIRRLTSASSPPAADHCSSNPPISCIPYFPLRSPNDRPLCP